MTSETHVVLLHKVKVYPLAFLSMPRFSTSPSVKHVTSRVGQTAVNVHAHHALRIQQSVRFRPVGGPCGAHAPCPLKGISIGLSDGRRHSSGGSDLLLILVYYWTPQHDTTVARRGAPRGKGGGGS